jgi:hypothetical protein
MADGLTADTASRLVQVGTSAFLLEGERSLVERSRDFVYPLDAVDPDSPRMVRLGRRAREVHAEGGTFTVLARSEEELLEQLDYRLTCEALALDEASTALHAACIRLRAGPVLLLGPHRSGKSTLAAALGRLGEQVWSDDITLLTGGALPGVRPLSRALRVRPDAARLLGIATGDETARIAPAAPPPGWHLPVACVRLRFCAGAPMEWARPAATDAMVALMECTFGFAAAPARRLPHLVALISHVPVFTFTYGSAPLEGARALRAHLEAMP